MNDVQPSTGTTYWIEWCSHTWRKNRDGFITHAVAEPGNGRAVCGVKPDDAGGGLIPADDEPGCIRCRKALRKRGIIPELTSITAT